MSDVIQVMYRCHNCNTISSSDDINKKTLNDCCLNRADRRKYVPIEKTSQTDRKWYRCPLCGENVRRKGWTRVNE